MAKIKQIFASEILDSRGEPTIKTNIVLDNGLKAQATVPVGASKGRHEAMDLRDHDALRYNGQGVLKACKNIQDIITPALIGVDISEQTKIDEILIGLDATPNKFNLGANALLSVSFACCRVGAIDSNLPLYKYIREKYNTRDFVGYKLPIPMFNMINGGKHSDNRFEIQEFNVIPFNDLPFREKFRAGVEIFHLLKNTIKTKHGYFATVGDQGGFTPSIVQNKEAMDLLQEAVNNSSYKLGEEILFGLDVAADGFYDIQKRKYIIEKKENTAGDMIDLYKDWINKYPLAVIEDGLAQDSWLQWKELKKILLGINPEFLIVGDNLFTTNITLLEKGILNDSANTISIKANQIGTLNETIKCINFARRAGYKIIISHRSGETNDDFIADLAVAVNADFIKAGAPNRGERVAKYNRLMEIEEELKN
ncbi:phosphopyruvate hydratase [Patescibacteria group bacterium]|nr:phosphopyruvate hydratase [Patescibacteria group bacterium]